MFNLIESQILLWNFNVHRNSTKYLNFKTTILEYYQKLTFSYHVCRTRAPSRISISGILYKCLISYPLWKHPKHFCTQSFMLKHPIILADILKSAKNLMQHSCCNFFNAIFFAEKFEINFAIRITWFLLRNMYYITYYTYISPNWSNLDYHQSDPDRVESVWPVRLSEKPWLTLFRFTSLENSHSSTHLYSSDFSKWRHSGSWPELTSLFIT